MGNYRQHVKPQKKAAYENEKRSLSGKINPDPHPKRNAGRVAATPAPQSDRVGRASCTLQPVAYSPFQRADLAVGACSRRWRNTPAASLNPSLAMPEQIRTYTELRQKIHDDLRLQHPEWVQPGGESPICDSYDARLMELIDALTRTEVEHVQESPTI
jgi:hypothetical protein